ncbi:aspartyl protease family protein [Aquiflexum gelatinilyticum]|uniref:Aspartyl protease family protein n=1 Tax=Aquiflexum gelatinilyticum TaxID=2961943 RepID=A0A9X2SZY7_9BACT|nr:aspartyl protease family protein [Aquiflexum gelatinilyticum]
MRRLFLLILIFSCNIFANVAQVPGFYMREKSKKVELPIIVSNNLVVIPLSINNGPPVNFLLDTGVKTNILFSKTFGNYIGLNYTRKLDLVGADGQTILTASVSPNNYIDMGPLEGIYQTLLVLDEDFMELEQVIGIPVFGVIGYEFFKYNPVKIDYDKQKITFYAGEMMKRKPFGYKKVDIKLDNSKPYIKGEVKQVAGSEIETKLLIDIGANHGLLLNRETSDKIFLPKNHIASDLGRSLGGDLFGYVGRTFLLNINGIKFKDVITSFPEETEFSYVIRESGRQGSIGSEILGRLTVIMDYNREKMYIKRGDTFAVPFEFDMSGITPRLMPSDEKVIFVTQIREGSPAYEAGIRMRDEFQDINNIPIDFWELPDLIKLFRSEEGREIKITMKRYLGDDSSDFEIKEFKFKLRRQI